MYAADASMPKHKLMPLPSHPSVLCIGSDLAATARSEAAEVPRGTLQCGHLQQTPGGRLHRGIEGDNDALNGRVGTG
jgi:hypothetical protein